MMGGVRLPHPVTGIPYDSPVPPGAGWPGDPADTDTPVARDPAQVVELAGAATDLTTLQARVSVCAACPRLVQWRREVAASKRKAFADQPYWGRPVPSFGAAAPRLLIVGLAPAAHGANRTGRMFTGDRSGDFLYAALHRAGVATQPHSEHAGDGLALRGARITAPVRCAPPANTPTSQERSTCAPWFDRELVLLGPRVTGILALGQIGWTATLAALRRTGWDVPVGRSTRFGHQAIVPLRRPDGAAAQLVGCYHVSQQNTFTGRLTEPMLDAAIAAALRE